MDVLQKLIDAGTPGTIFKGSYSEKGKQIWGELRLSDEILETRKWNLAIFLDHDECEIYLDGWEECFKMMTPVPYELAKDAKVISGTKYA